MTFRIESAAARSACMALALAVFSFLAFFSIRAAAADYLVGENTPSGYQRAVRLEAGNAENWHTLGRYWQYNLENPDAAAAMAAYRRSLAINPRSADAWLDLASLLESEGQASEARSAFLAAQKAYPISAEVAWRYGNFLLRQGDRDAAFAEFRRSVEADPLRGAEAFSRAIRVEPDIRKVLGPAIPPYRRVYLDIIRGLAQNQLEDALTVWRQLPPGSPLRLEDAQPLVDKLREQHRIREAWKIWSEATALAGLPGEEPADSLVWDGGFETGVSNIAFSWQYPPIWQGVEIARDSGVAHSGRFSLRVSFDGKSNLYFHSVCHVIPVEPGARYRLTAWIRTRGLTTDERVRLVLHAVSVASDPLYTASPEKDQPWSEVALDWTSPPGEHQGSLCLVRNASAEPDNRIRGEFWIDDVALRPLGPPGP